MTRETIDLRRPDCNSVPGVNAPGYMLSPLRGWVTGVCCVLLGLSFALFITTIDVVAQQPATKQPRPPKHQINAEDLYQILDYVAQGQESDDNGSAAAIAEDMEVLSTIIHENVGAVYRRSVTASTIGADLKESQNKNFIDQFVTAKPIAEPLFDHIPGTGISIQMRIPKLLPDKPKAADDKTPAPTRWEATRKRLRTGQSLEMAWTASCKACHQHPFPQQEAVSQDFFYQFFNNVNNVYCRKFTDITYLQQWIDGSGAPRPPQSAVIQMVIDTLAENGQHLRGLEPSERVTISLSYWDKEPALRPIGTSLRDWGKKDPPQQPNPNEKAADDDASDDSTEAPTDGEARASDAANPAEEKPRGSSIRGLLLEKLKKAGQEPSEGQSKKESRAAQIRRLYLDTVGLPPSAEEVARFLNDGSADAYRRLVERLMKRPDQPYDSFIRAQLVREESRLPSRTRISISATVKQLSEVGSGKLSRLEFTRQVQVRVFSPKK